ncbi:hypothetical protein [Halalkalibacterium ligniniphilum]|nr:hypothetical protein [Halalkalibacterium ligniniphilum]
MERMSDRYTTAELNPEMLSKVKALEEEIQAVTNREVIIIAYEESVHNAT